MLDKLRSTLLLAAALGLAASPALAGEARVLDDDGNVLTVGNWRFDAGDDGRILKVPDSRTLSWELHDGHHVIAAGTVPGSDDGLRDGTPALSRDPVSGDLLLVWSRQTNGGTRELAAMSFRGDDFDVASELVLAEGATNQRDPVVLHDAEGRPVVAWRIDDSVGRIMMLVLDRDHSELAREELSAGVSVDNGAPLLGVNAQGGIFVAFAGREPASEEPRVFVLSAGDIGGGVMHNPLPILDLIVQNDQPLSSEVQVEPDDEPSALGLPRLNATVLAGTAVVWWEKRADDGSVTVSYLNETPEHGWGGSDVGAIALPATTADARHEALRLIEARMRRIVARFRDETPIASAPGLARTLNRQ